MRKLAIAVIVLVMGLASAASASPILSFPVARAAIAQSWHRTGFHIHVGWCLRKSSTKVVCAARVRVQVTIGNGKPFYEWSRGPDEAVLRMGRVSVMTLGLNIPFPVYMSVSSAAA